MVRGIRKWGAPELYKRRWNPKVASYPSKSLHTISNMKAVFAFVAVLAVFGLAFAADDDDDHSNHCHIDDYPTIHIDIGKSIDLPGACLKLYCKNTDLFEVVNTCKHASEAENKSFADKLVKGQVCN